MEAFSKLMFFTLVSVALIVGVLVTFSYVTGIDKPFDFLSRIRISVDPYLLIGSILLLAIIGFGAFIFFKEKFLGYT